MIISLVVAQSKNHVIGKDNQLPWHLPADLQHFKKLTMGKPIVMGRKTFESIGRPLPGRQNVVLSGQYDLKIPGCDVFHSIKSALVALAHEPEIMVIGGANLYQQMIDQADRLYITRVDIELDGDAFFPEIDLAAWHLLSEEPHQADGRNPITYCFQVWEKAL